MFPSESRPGGGVDDNQLRQRRSDRLHKTLHEPRHQYPLQGGSEDPSLFAYQKGMAS